MEQCEIAKKTENCPSPKWTRGNNEEWENGWKRGVGLKITKISVCCRTLIDSQNHFKQCSVELNYCAQLTWAIVIFLAFLTVSPPLCKSLSLPTLQTNHKSVASIKIWGSCALHTDCIWNMFTKQTDRIGETKTAQTLHFIDGVCVKSKSAYMYVW